MRIDEADEARRQHAGEAQTLRGEVSELKGLIEDLQRDGRKNKDVIIRMEAQVEEAGDLRAKVLELSTELATARQRVEEMRGEKVKQAAAHEKALQELRDKVNDGEVERQRVQSELDVSAAKIKVMPPEPLEHFHAKPQRCLDDASRPRSPGACSSCARACARVCLAHGTFQRSAGGVASVTVEPSAGRTDVYGMCAKAERNASETASKHAMSECAELRYKIDLLQKQVDEKQMDLLEAERAIGRAADKALVSQRELEHAASAHQRAMREADEAGRARKLAEDQLQVSHEARRDAEAQAEALSRINKDMEKQLQAARERADGLEGRISAMEPQVMSG
jgi:DNA repair exonuclease SbcCD ATPase subunit